VAGSSSTGASVGSVVVVDPLVVVLERVLELVLQLGVLRRLLRGSSASGASPPR
jgi:hypothetical protein